MVAAKLDCVFSKPLQGHSELPRRSFSTVCEKCAFGVLDAQTTKKNGPIPNGRSIAHGLDWCQFGAKQRPLSRL
jgi:hypothetical protein